MYYLFEFIKPHHKNTYIPLKCLSKIDTNLYDNILLIKELDAKGIVYKHQGNNWKKFWLNTQHENIIYSANFGEICDLVKEYERKESLSELLDN